MFLARSKCYEIAVPGLLLIVSVDIEVSGFATTSWRSLASRRMQRYNVSAMMRCRRNLELVLLMKSITRVLRSYSEWHEILSLQFDRCQINEQFGLLQA